MPVAIRYLDGLRFQRALYAGIGRVVSRREYINKINVFPVADGDTGTNLAFTLKAIISDVGATLEEGVSSTLSKVADAALDGSRGNSGAILAQFLQGLCEGHTNVRRFTANQFAEAVDSGSKAAHDAIADPKEGTILTVMQDFAQEIHNQIQSGVNDFEVLISQGLIRARASLENTRLQLSVLREADVVDAGGQGFVDLLEGIYDYIVNGSIRESTALKADNIEAAQVDQNNPHTASAALEQDITHRYCTECFVIGDGIDRGTLRQQLTVEACSSLVIAGSKSKVKLHIHVDEPARVFKICERFGEISGQKADDMFRQNNTLKQSRKRVAVITDSAADIPEHIMDALNIHMIPLRLSFGAQEYLDKVSLGSDEFYRMLRESEYYPQTSQPPLGDFRRLYQFLASHHDEVISVSLSGEVSGTRQAAQTAAARVSKNVHVVDSRNAAVGQGLLAIYAAEAAQAGYSAQEIISMLQEKITATRIYLVIDDISYGVRGGRIPASFKRIAQLLRITPVISANAKGQVKFNGLLLGHHNKAEKFARYITKRMKKNKRYRLLIGHCGCLDKGHKFHQSLKALLPNLESSYLTSAGTALGVHAGPGSLMVGIQEWQELTPKEPPKEAP